MTPEALEITPENRLHYLSTEEVVEVLKTRFGRNDWAGYPMPLPGASMTIHPNYPFAKIFEKTFPDVEEPEPEPEENEPEEDAGEVVNDWFCHYLGRRVQIVREKDGSYRTAQYLASNPVDRMARTLDACRVWSVAAEMRAIKKLRRHVSDAQWRAYVLTGTFAEGSLRSGTGYIFRRLRPTIAFSLSTGRFLAALCSHPIGYYDDTWAGAMVPTDDLLSHLLLMRADEHYFWRISNQHPAQELGALA
jgi:hypothetical protein